MWHMYVDCALQDISLPVELLADDVSYVTNYPLLIDAYYICCYEYCKSLYF